MNHHPQPPTPTRPGGSQRWGSCLIVLGIILVLAAGALLLSTLRPAPQRAAATPTLNPLPTQVLTLGPAAQTAAALLPTLTPIAAAGPPAGRASAAQRIAIPARGIDAPVTEVGWRVVGTGAQWETVAGAAGHHKGSADPGQAGNCVLSGHSAEAGGAVFRRLSEVAVGDRIELSTVGGMRYRYTVRQVLRVDEQGASLEEKRAHARWLDPSAEPVVTLVTCWPDWAYTHRIIVRAALEGGTP